MRPHRRRTTTENDTEATTEQVEQPPPERPQRRRGLQQAAANGISLILKTHACDVTVKLLWLSVLHSAASRPAKMFEFSTLMGPAVVPVYSLLTRSNSKSDLPHQVTAVAEFLKGCRTPATISILLRTLKGLVAHRPLIPEQNSDMTLSQIQQNGEQLRDSVAAMYPSVGDLFQITRERSPSNMAGYAEIYRSVIHLFKCTLDWHLIESARRFAIRFDDTDAELMRYLMACNVLDVC